MVENEIQFLSWQEFEQMVPSILKLEVTRLEKLIRISGTSTDTRNTLVRARMDVKRFIRCVQQHTQKEHVQEICQQYLRLALLGVCLIDEEVDSQMVAYVRGRLQYVHDRIPFIY